MCTPLVQVNIKGKHGRTAMYLAAEGGHIFIVKLLLQHPDIDVNSRYGDRQTDLGSGQCHFPLPSLQRRHLLV